MMERMWGDILRRFGQEVTLCRRGERTALRALVQPVLSQSGEQRLPTPLGLGEQDRFRYLGPAGHPLDPDTLVEWKGRQYQVQSAHLAGEGVCPHWWAMLRPRDEVAL